MAIITPNRTLVTGRLNQTTYQPPDYSGVTNYQVKKIGAYHMIGDDDYEPQRNNNFEIHIYKYSNGNLTYTIDNLRTADKGRLVNQKEAQDCLTLSAVSVGQISTDVGVIEVPYGNTKVKFAGLPTISTSDIVYSDYIGKATERIIAAWHSLVFNPNTEVIGRASNYKKPADLIETAPDGSCVRVWRLKGCWPSNVQYGAYDYNGGGTVRQITMTLTYDIAIPLDS